MAFTGYAFVLFFFVLVLPLRWLLPARFAPRVLLVASAVFYLSWGLRASALLAGLTLFTYAAGRLLQRRPKRRRLVVGLTIGGLLGALATFKYSALLLALFPALAAGSKLHALPLPLGLSFYVFEMVSYVVDVYRGDPGARSLPEFALYVSYFPHLIAGPIVRASELLPQLRSDVRFDARRAADGMFLLLTGYVKKMVLADNLALFADTVMSKPGDYNRLEILAAVAAYTGQIFCDFSGYTDIARGASAILGYDLPKNFDYPYLSASITEFWRRWHMTLSRWLRDYLYIPLGGSRGRVFATYRNLLLTMTLGGLWHGARTTFIAWGAYHGALLAAHKLFVSRTPSLAPLRATPAYRVLAAALTLTLVAIGWVLFRAQSWDDAALVFRRIATAPAPPGWRPSRLLDHTQWYLCGLVALHAAGAVRLGVRTHDALPAAARGLLWASMIIVAYWLSTASPTFLYFYF